MLAKVSGQISAADKEATEKKKEDLVGERQQLDFNRRANASQMTRRRNNISCGVLFANV